MNDCISIHWVHLGADPSGPISECQVEDSSCFKHFYNFTSWSYARQSSECCVRLCPGYLFVLYVDMPQDCWLLTINALWFHFLPVCLLCGVHVWERIFITIWCTKDVVLLQHVCAICCLLNVAWNTILKFQTVTRSTFHVLIQYKQFVSFDTR